MAPRDSLPLTRGRSRTRKSLSAPSSPVSSTASSSHHDRPPPRGHSHSPQPPPPPLHPRHPRHLVYDSPRLEFPDTQLFPHPTTTAHQWRHPVDRRRSLSQMAGDHQPRDHRVWTVHPRRTPESLRFGFPKAAAHAIEDLTLPLWLGQSRGGCHEEYDAAAVRALPLWLDVVHEIFPNVKHLRLEGGREGLPSSSSSSSSSTRVDDNSSAVTMTTTNTTSAMHHRNTARTGTECVPDEKEDGDDTEEHKEASQCSVDKYAVAFDKAEPNRETLATGTDVKAKDSMDEASLRRLYVLYRLPGLETLNGTVVTARERALAFPRNRANEPSPLGQERTDQAKAKVKANDSNDTSQNQHQHSPTPPTCLLDEDENDEEEHEETGIQSPLSRRALAEMSIGLDGRGLPSLSMSASTPHGGSQNPASLRSVDQDRWEYASVESSTACEWSAACGGLSLPYFRGNKLPKNRFHLKLGSSENRRHSVAPRLSTNEASNKRISTVPPRDCLDPLPLVREPATTRTTPPISPVQSHSEDHYVTTTSSRLVTSPASSTSSCLSPNSMAMPDRIRLPGSASLTSPFPMQFRLRAKEALNLSTTTTTTNMDLSVTTDFPNANSGTVGPSPPLAPREIPLAFMETIEVPISLTRTRSSPTKLPSSLQRRMLPPSISTKGELPPPCPNGRRKFAGTTTSTMPTLRGNSTTTKSRRGRTAQRGAYWRDKLNARSTSIIVDEDDDDDDLSSDEENLVVTNGRRRYSCDGMN